MKRESNLEMQGLSSSSSSEWVRFTPTLSTLCILTGTLLGEPFILWFFAMISIVGSMSEHHLFDVIYDRWVRPFTKSPVLSVNPPPRRFAMLIAGVWSAVTAILFFWGAETAGYISGMLLGIAGSFVATTHFCLGSWMYRILERRSHTDSI